MAGTRVTRERAATARDGDRFGNDDYVNNDYVNNDNNGGGTSDAFENTEKLIQLLRTDLVQFHQFLEWACVGRELANLVSGKMEVRIRREHSEFVVSAFPGGNIFRTNLRNALAAHNKSEQQKRCLRCKEAKVVEAFARSKETRDGRWRYCLECERKRRKKWKGKGTGTGRSKHKKAAAAPLPMDRN